ncbi:MAG: hypothetical protein GYA21_06445 [Myxococcales bacterium]|nr:hypothetical protein [Myxococcales bacterium]
MKSKLATAISAILLAALCSLWACDRNGPEPEKDLTIVVEADRSKIAQEEKALAEKRSLFEQEKEALERERRELEQAREQARGVDQVQEKRLLDSERRLAEKERAMREREASLEAERATIDKQKQALGVKAGAAGLPGAEILQRERGLAERERGLAQREGLLAQREKSLAEREAELARREAAFLKLQGQPVRVLAPTAGGGSAVTRQAVDRSLKDALARMRQKGLLWADLPAEVSGVQAEVTRALKKNELARAADLVEQLDVAVNAIQVDADFIDRKFKWLNELKKNRPPAAADAETVKTLLRRVTQLVGDGQFAAANQELNRIHALLSR